MRTTIIAAAIIAASLTACAGDKPDLAYLSRQEVSNAISDCEAAGQRASVIYTKADWNGRKVPTPVDVQCMPRNAGSYRAGLSRDDS
jgi:hypothetical protein